MAKSQVWGVPNGDGDSARSPRVLARWRYSAAPRCRYVSLGSRGSSLFGAGVLARDRSRLSRSGASETPRLGTTPRGPTPRTESSESVAAPYVVLPRLRADAGRSMLEYDVDFRPAELLLARASNSSNNMSWLRSWPSDSSTRSDRSLTTRRLPALVCDIGRRPWAGREERSDVRCAPDRRTRNSGRCVVCTPVAAS
jgi:hypothetical protein